MLLKTEIIVLGEVKTGANAMVNKTFDAFLQKYAEMTNILNRFIYI